MKGKILFIDTVHEILKFKLEQEGFVCTDASNWDLNKIEEDVEDYTGIVIRSRFKIDAAFLEKCHSLKFIARAGAGMENIDQIAAAEKNILCLNAPEGNRNAVAEHALGMLLALLNKLIKSDKEVKGGFWLREENRGIEVDGKTIGIIGFGNTGSAFAKKLKGFDCRILIYDPYVKIDKQSTPGVTESTLESLYEQCDIVSLHVPLTDETLHLVDRKFINSFSKPFYLINTSRGKVVKTSDLIEGIEKGFVAGAALDVLESESFSFENLRIDRFQAEIKKLIEFENVILSPHIAGWTIESHKKISEILFEKIKTQLSRP